MKTNYKLTSVLSLSIGVFMLASCTKSNLVTPKEAVVADAVTGKHVYGLLPTSPEEYNAVPKFSMDDFKSNKTMLATGSPAVLTLATPAVRDQGSLGSCTGFAGTEAYEITYNYKFGAFPAIMSPAFLYYEERVNILGEKITADDGANMVNIDQALAKYGITTETLYPYPSSDKSTAYKTAPSANAISTALGYKISTYKLINTGDTAAVKTCLRSNIPVMFGFNVYDNSKYTIFEGLTTTSYTYSPLTAAGALVKGVSLLGGHANVIIGYDDSKKAFKVINSWSTDWGLNGYYYLPYSVFSSTKIVPQGGVYYMSI